MKTTNTLVILGVAIWIILAMPLARAGDGHAHVDVSTSSVGSTFPRFTAISETFELVGVVNGKQLTIYLDRYAGGEPVKDAKIELELGGIKIPVKPHAEGEFEATLVQELKSGVLSVEATVIAGEEADLLVGELDIHGEMNSETTPHTYSWKEYTLWIGIAGGTLLLLIALLRRLRMSRKPHFGGAA